MFTNGRLERPIHVEMPSCVNSKSEHDGIVSLERSSLYCLKDVVRTSNELFFNTLSEFGLSEINTAPCVFVGSNAVVLCYVDKDSSDSSYHKSGKHFPAKDL